MLCFMTVCVAVFLSQNELVSDLKQENKTAGPSEVDIYIYIYEGCDWFVRGAKSGLKICRAQPRKGAENIKT